MPEFEEKIYSIYQIVSPNNKVYIGQTSVGKTRWNDYYSLTCKTQKILYNSLVKYTPKAHRFVMLFENLTYEEADKKEIELVALYKKLNISLNIKDGGKTGTNPDLGHKINKFDLDGNFLQSYPSIRRAARECNLYPQNIMENLNGISGRCGDYIFSKEHTVTKFISKRSNPVYQYTLTGNLIAQYTSIVEAAKCTNIPTVSISGNINGRNNTAYGYVFTNKIKII